MEKTVRTKLPIGRIVKIEELEDGSYEVVQKVVEISENELDDTFILIEAEKLSLEDEFMQWVPKTRAERETKKLIIEAITLGVKNFYHPKYDPAFSVDEKNICFVSEMNPAVGKSYNWWKKVAKKYNSERKSRLGTRLEYGAFLGVLIKKLVKMGKKVEWAWNAVCNDSKELGHYWNSKNAKHTFELTGSRCIYGFYDLSNTYKILAEDDDAAGFWVAGGGYYGSGENLPLATLDHKFARSNDCYCGVGWIVLEK